MSYKIVKLLPLFAALALCACQSVTSKQPVGARGPALDPKIWNREWQSSQGSLSRTTIKDAALGLVEVKALKPLPKPGEPKSLELIVRTLGSYTIINGKLDPKPGAPYLFLRIVISQSNFVLFSPEPAVFAELIKKGKLKGTLDKDKDKDGKLTGSSTLESFSEEDFQRFKDKGFETRTLFQEDPAAVSVSVK